MKGEFDSPSGASSEAYRANWERLYGERAAIMEFCGNLPREDAERLAVEDIRSHQADRQTA